jgi:hypothetical protein
LIVKSSGPGCFTGSPDFNSMRALFITSSFPPLPESQTIRNIYIIQGLKKAGIDVTVVTGAEEAGDPTLRQLLSDEVVIARTGRCFYDVAQGCAAQLPGAPVRQWSRSAIAVLSGRLLAPDVRFDWRSKALRVARHQLRQRHFDTIISSSGSYAAHEVAAQLAAETRLPWIAEYGDPWALNPLPPLSLPRIRRRNLRTERRALQRCRQMIVTTKQTADLYQEWLGPECPAIAVIPCGFTRVGPVRGHSAASRHWSIAYVGSASRTNRDLRSIMELLEEVLTARPEWQIELSIVGSYSPAFAQFARGLRYLRVRFSGWVSYAESINRMEAADVLVLYGNSQPIQVPGKVFNYVATLRPILYLGQIAKEIDPTREILNNVTGIRAYDPTNPVARSSLIAEFDNFDRWDREAQRRATDIGWLEQYRWEHIGVQFATVVSRIATQRRDEASAVSA